MSKQSVTLALFTMLLLFGLLITNQIVVDENVEVCSVEVEPVETEVELEIEEPTGEWVSLGIWVLTAYCPCQKCCGQFSNGITSTGVTARELHTIAVDPKVIPYGTEVLIDGVIYTAEDCGGAIKGNRIDVYHDSHEQALKFGRQKKEVFIWKEVY